TRQQPPSVAAPLEQLDRLLVQCRRPPELATRHRHSPEALKGVEHHKYDPLFAKQRQGLLPGRPGALVLALADRHIRAVVQRPANALLVAELAAYRQALLGQRRRARVVAENLANK